ncbi:hypothetical protein HCH_01163 [Hahella chejuensis KCTC 2396]|uniref:Uncharacterized protein n=1 Tax=Hahella chejuensis (strain KCTC 2396) TaxID=349521 RepID=Q2SMT4_HAHCH|nr:hypothetical protein HCH_01163 [Hahella chejuensis KCTC 2396]
MRHSRFTLLLSLCVVDVTVIASVAVIDGGNDASLIG